MSSTASPSTPRRLPIGPSPSSPPLSRNNSLGKKTSGSTIPTTVLADRTPVQDQTSSSSTTAPRTPKLDLQIPASPLGGDARSSNRRVPANTLHGSVASAQASSASPSSPYSRSPSTQTHAGGILPPASFFRPAKPNSTPTRPPSNYSLRPSPPTKSTSIGGIGIGLPFKVSPTSPTASSKPSALPTSAPGALKTHVTRSDGSRQYGLGKSSREPLLPIGERSLGRSAAASRMPIGIESRMGPTGPSMNAATPPRLSVRGSFEKLWKRNSAGAAGPSTAPAPERTWRNSISSVSEKMTSLDQTQETGDSVAGPEREIETSLPIAPMEFEERNHYAPEDPVELEDPRRVSWHDIGDGPMGGGVVMEMGRVSQDVRALESPKDRTEFDEDVEMGQRHSRSLDNRRLPRPLNVAGLPPSQLRNTAPMHGTPQSRHAHFAPPPPKSPKTPGYTPESTSSSSSSGASTSKPSPAFPVPRISRSPLHWRRHSAAVPPPPYMVPVMSPSTSKPLRNYEFHPSSNEFFMKGHMITGGDSALPFFGALTLVLGVAGTWFGTTCVFWWRRGMGGQAIAIVGAYLCLLTVASMFMTAFKDPGIIPRDLDPEPPYPPASSTASLGATPMPLPRDLRVRSGSVRVKYCVTCKTYRPPRSSHCKMCDNCVDGCDHHCQWVNNCIGRRNYTHFITFVVTASVTNILILITSVFHIYLEGKDRRIGASGAIKHAIGSTVTACLCIIVIWPLLALALYHVRLLFLNITTIEQVRQQAHRKLTKSSTPLPNPFSIGRWYHNLAYLLFRPAGYDWVDLSGVALHDTRKVNPGFVVRPASSAANHDVEDEETREEEDAGDADWR
ncbi:Eukaryotic peptide chain release factor GTP-binding subunit [Tulasnella sp. JGI-2019a]|nr:Eukaryotic peptide chain release factor GTP-binding subunit [Tulasnella sp. JGI-2019a]